MLRLRTLGGCRIERDGLAVESLAGQRKALALLAFVAAAGARGVARDVVLAHLWPESDEERARGALKQLVHASRRQLRAPGLLVGTAEIRLDPAVLSSDVDEFRLALSRGEDESAAILYEGPFLDGFFLRGAGEYERWAAGERARLAREHADVLARLADRASAAGDRAAAVRWWRRLAAADPLSARAAIGLMRALDAIGERPAALQHARVYQALVEQEVGGPPDGAFAQVVAALRSGPAAVAPAAGVSETTSTMPAATLDTSSRASALQSIAVLPFVNTSGEAADEAFSAGLSDELIGAISRVPGIAVCGRTSVFALVGRGVGAREIAEALGVSAVVEGSVQRAGDRLKVSARLVRGADERVLWSDAFDRTLDDVFAVQEEIARATADALRVTLVADAHRLTRRTADLAAYELYLKGRHLLNTRSASERIAQAVRFFDRAVALDPTYAPAYAGLADAHAYLAVFAYCPAHEAFPRALAAARKALALDDTLAEAHASLAHALCVYDFEWTAAERAFRRATTLDPGYGFARLAFAICLQDQGRFAEAVDQLEAGRAADRLAPHLGAVLGRVYVNAREPDRAIRVLSDVLEFAPDLDLVHQQLGHAHLQQRNARDALASFRRATELSGARDSAHLAYGFAVTGQRAEAERMLAALGDRADRRQVLPFHVAMVHAGLGNVDESLSWLERGFDERASFMDGVMVTPAFEPLHAEPRWRHLLRRMGLVR